MIHSSILFIVGVALLLIACWKRLEAVMFEFECLLPEWIFTTKQRFIVTGVGLVLYSSAMLIYELVELFSG